METELEIKEFYKNQHDLLSALYYDEHQISKEAFDHAHGMIWANLDTELITQGYKAPPAPVRDLAAELDVVINRVKDLEQLK